MSSPKPYYDAEYEVRFMLKNGGTVQAHGSTFVLPEERKFGDLASVQRYVEHVCEWLDLGAAPKVVKRNGDKEAHYQFMTQSIHVPDHLGSNHSWAMREIVILHELAHHLEHDGHGEYWAGAFVMLVEKCIGPEAGFLLSCAFSQRGVQMKRREV